MQHERDRHDPDEIAHQQDERILPPSVHFTPLGHAVEDPGEKQDDHLGDDKDERDLDERSHGEDVVTKFKQAVCPKRVQHG